MTIHTILFVSGARITDSVRPSQCEAEFLLTAEAFLLDPGFQKKCSGHVIVSSVWT